ncbi:hypothetical protein D3C75_949530 [compost metagenome]
MPVAEEANVVDLFVVANLFAEPINVVQAILIVYRAVGFATPVDVGEASSFVQLFAKLLNIQGRQHCR